MQDWNQTYPTVSDAVAPDYRQLPQPQIEQVLRGVLGESVDLPTAEGLFDDIGNAFGSAGRAVGRAAQSAAPTLERAGAGALSGAMAGSALGPYGMLAGALVGGTAAALTSPGGKKPAPPPPSPPSNIATSIGQIAGPALNLLGTSGTGDSGGQLLGGLSNLLGGSGTGSTGAIGQLLGALASPTTQRALAAMLLGPAGRPTVTTPRGSALPVAAITNLLATLAHQASAEWESISPYGQLDYLTEDIDTSSPDARAQWLYGQLEPVDVQVQSGTSNPNERRDARPGIRATEPSWIDEMYDEMELQFCQDN